MGKLRLWIASTVISVIQYAKPIRCDQYHRHLKGFCQIADPVLWRDGDFPAADAFDKKRTMMALNPSQDVRKMEQSFGFDGRARSGLAGMGRKSS